MAQKTQPVDLQLLRRLVQQSSHSQQQGPARPSPDPVAEAIADDRPAGSGSDHPQHLQLATAVRIAANEGDGFSRKRQASAFEQHGHKDDPITPGQN